MDERWWRPLTRIADAAIIHVDLTWHAARAAKALESLDETERTRWGRYRHLRPRTEFALCRAALRAVLCRHLDCRNDDLAFRASPHGKPSALVCGARAPVSFNVSHSGAHGLIALAERGRVGVDVEERVSRPDPDGPIRTVFSRAEQDELATAQGAHKVDLFFTLWTMKEALIKALGVGLSLDTSGFEIPPRMRRGSRTGVFRCSARPGGRLAARQPGHPRLCRRGRHRGGAGVGVTSERVWEIPKPLSTHEVRLDEHTVTTLRRHGNPAGPRLVLCHGSGLAVDLYVPFWSLLTDDFDLVVYDLRNHGWNAVGARELHNMPTLIKDHVRVLEAIDRHCGTRPKIGIYHSVSALISLLWSSTADPPPAPGTVRWPRRCCWIRPSASRASPRWSWRRQPDAPPR